MLLSCFFCLPLLLVAFALRQACRGSEVAEPRTQLTRPEPTVPLIAINTVIIVYELILG